jgi:hypothetical protein
MTNQPTARPIDPIAVNEKPAAELLGLSPSSLEKDRVQGHLGVPYVKAGRRVLYRLSDLQSWLDEHRIVPTATDSLVDEGSNPSEPLNKRGGV